MKINVIIGIVAVVALILGIVAVVGGGVIKEITQIGSVVGPDNPGFNHWSIGGITTHYKEQGAFTSTTTICSLKSPAASSTLVFASVKFTTSSTTASRIYIGKGAAPNATTSELGNGTIAANGYGIVVASTSPLTAGQDDIRVFAPSQYLNFSMATAQGTAANIGTFSPVAKCKAVWIEN